MKLRSTRQAYADNDNGLSQPRLAYLDFLRIIAMFAVVFLHTSASFYTHFDVGTANFQIAAGYDACVRWGVDLFVMVSGALILSHGSAGDFSAVKKRFLRMAMALVIWGIFYNLCYPILQGGIFHFDYAAYDIPNQLLLACTNILFGKAWFHLWFLYMLLGLYLFSPVILQFLENCPRKIEKYALILFIVIGTGIPFVNSMIEIISQYLGYMPPGSLTNHLVEVTGYVGIFLAGHYFSRYEVSRRMRIYIVLTGIIGLLFTVGFGEFLYLTTQEKASPFWNNLYPNTVGICFALFVAAKSVFSKNRIHRYMEIISNRCFVLYLVHAFVLSAFFRYLIDWFFVQNPIIIIPAIAVTTFFVSLGISILLKKLSTISSILALHGKNARP